MHTLSVDPGPVFSAWIEMSGNRPVLFAKELTPVVRERVRAFDRSGTLAIEMIASYGLGVGAEIFQTCVEIGRMVEIAPHALLVPRGVVKMHLCHSMRAKDPNVRLALLDRYGGEKAAKGTKAEPGPLRGVSSDVWAALALACYVHDTAEALG